MPEKSPSKSKTANTPLPVPPDLKRALAANTVARGVWQRIPPSHQREHLEAIEGAKKEETRARRVAKAVDLLVEVAQRKRGTVRPQLSTKALAQKLLIKPGMRASVVNAPDGFVATLGAPADATVNTRLRPDADVILLFVARRAQLDAHLDALLRVLKPETVLWMAYPKGGQLQTDMTRDIGWDSARRAGLEGVAQIALDGVWSALRFRHP